MALIAWLNDMPPGQYHCIHYFNSFAFTLSVYKMPSKFSWYIHS